MAVKPIPEGYHSVTPYLIVKGAAKAIDYYKKAFGATEIMRMPGRRMVAWRTQKSRLAIRTLCWQTSTRKGRTVARRPLAARRSA